MTGLLHSGNGYLAKYKKMLLYDLLEFEKYFDFIGV